MNMISRDIYESNCQIVEEFYKKNNLPDEDMTLLKYEYKRLQAKYVHFLNEENAEVYEYKTLLELGQQMANIGQTLALYEIQKNGGGFVG
tara:strand:+ start:2618 stop:2887 length:270 start_codon:yes stop_codon:yes gene_type:complete